MLAEEREFATISAEKHVESVARNRHRPDYTFDNNVGEQPSEQNAEDAQSPSYLNKIERKRRSGCIAGQSCSSASTPKRILVSGTNSRM